MGFFDRFRKKVKTELTKEQLVDMCISGRLKKNDIIYTRDINVLDAALSLIENGDIKNASKLVGYVVQNRPSMLAGNFLLSHSELDVPEAGFFKYMLETKEERDMFYSLCRNGMITDASIGKTDDAIQTKIELAFAEGMEKSRNGIECRDELEYTDAGDEAGYLEDECCGREYEDAYEFIDSLEL